MGEKNQCDGCQRGLPVDTQGTHYDPAEAGVDAWSRYRIRCTRQRYAEPDPRDAEIARLRARVAKLEAAVAGELLCMDQDDTKFLELRAQLAAAQADNIALRWTLEQVRDYYRNGRWRGEYGVDVVMSDAIATPAPGAPLLDAVGDLEAAATGWHNAECPGIDQGLPLGECCRQSTALAAVRAVLSRAQDTAGISCQRDTE